MGEIVHTSRIKIVREKGPTPRAMIEGFSEPIYYGVHGGIKKFYKVEPEKEHAHRGRCVPGSNIINSPPGKSAKKEESGRLCLKKIAAGAR